MFREENALNRIIRYFLGIEPGGTESHVQDTTLYQVITSSKQYCGHIVFQDDVQLKLKTDKVRIVKILKENIRQVSIVKQRVPMNQLNQTMTWKQL
jgi:hypothetical protein